MPSLAAPDQPGTAGPHLAVQRRVEAIDAPVASSWTPPGNSELPLEPAAARSWPAGSEPSAVFATAPRMARPVVQTSLEPAPRPMAVPPLAQVLVPISHAAEGHGPTASAGPLQVSTFAAELPVQRADDASASAPQAPAAGPGGGASGGHSEKELDDLAHQLYDRLRSRLRMELLIDRERAGLITDLR
jgi:hypothetical protein